MARLLQQYKEKIVPELISKFGYKSIMEVPRITKITLNMGVGEAVADKKVLENAVKDLAAISGQKPVITKARKSIAGFKIREGYPIGCKVTLRGERAYEFLDRLISIALPRVRDFRGVGGKGFDGRDHLSGNRIRQGRCAARHEHHDHDHGEDRRRGQGAAGRIQISLPELRLTWQRNR